MSDDFEKFLSKYINEDNVYIIVIVFIVLLICCKDIIAEFILDLSEIYIAFVLVFYVLRLIYPFLELVALTVAFLIYELAFSKEIIKIPLFISIIITITINFIFSKYIKKLFANMPTFYEVLKQ